MNDQESEADHADDQNFINVRFEWGHVVFLEMKEGKVVEHRMTMDDLRKQVTEENQTTGDRP